MRMYRPSRAGGRRRNGTSLLNLFRIAALGLLLIGLLGISGCDESGNGDDPTGGDPAGEAQTVGAEGGTITYTSPDNPNIVVTLVIPPGALSEPTAITIAPGTTYPTSGDLLTDTAFTFTPETLTFAIPATLTITYDAAELGTLSADDLELQQAESGDWLQVEGATLDTAASQVSSSVSGLGTWGVVRRAVIRVAALYPTGENWNDYVQAADPTTACDGTETGGYSACLHGGEARAVEVRRQSTCDGLTATDALDAFTWTCDGSTDPVTMVATGLKDGKYLSDLIDWTVTPPAWKPNTVSVSKNGALYGTSDTTTWWGNPIVVDNDGMAAGDAVPGTIYVITADPAADYDLDADKVGLVVEPGVTLTGAVNPTTPTGPRYFHWLEGTLDVGGKATGVLWAQVDFSVMRGVHTTGGTSNGVQLDGSANNRISQVAIDGSAKYGLYINNSGSNTFSAVKMSNSGIYGIYLNNNASDNTLSQLSVDQSGQTGLVVTNSPNNSFSKVEVTNSASDGLFINSSDFNTFSGVKVSGSANSGVSLSGSFNNDFSQLTVDQNGQNGLYLNISSLNTFSGVEVSDSGTYGIYLTTSSSNSFSQVSVDNSGKDGLLISLGGSNTFAHTAVSRSGASSRGVVLSATTKNTLFDLIVSDSYLDGVYLLESTDNVLSGVRAANNGSYGIWLSTSAANNVLAEVTAANNGGKGIYIFGASNNTLLAVTAVNNGSDGIGVTDGTATNTMLSGASITNNAGNGLSLFSSSNITVANLASTRNSFGVKLTSTDYNTFTGLLKVGNNVSGKCSVTNGANPGLIDGTCSDDGTDGSFKYTNQISDAVLWKGVSQAGAFVGKVTQDDTVNTSDNNPADAVPGPGVAEYAHITDWSGFQNAYRLWGLDGGAFPDGYQQGRGPYCTNPSFTNEADCIANTGTWLDGMRIWDWSLANGDTGDPNGGVSGGAGPALQNVLPLPTESDIWAHTWSDTSTTTYLGNAVEIMGDGLGNDNALCESGETCLYTPNIGSYQGHGNLVSAGTVNGSKLSGITLMKYESNGY